MELLFVEDEFYTREGILNSVDWISLGINKVETACDGKEGLEKMSLQPDILLTDIRMPYYSGLELATQMKQLNPECEIIFLSSYSDKEYLFTAISLSSVAYIEKPVNVTELSQAIFQAVERRKQSMRFHALEEGQTVTAKHFTLPKHPDGTYRHSTHIVLTYLMQHYMEPNLSLDFLANYVHLNPSYLSDTFKKDTGKNLKQVITDVRIEKACALLADTNISVSDIAMQTGFRNANYFSKFFRQKLGVTPHEYRNMKGLCYEA